MSSAFLPPQFSAFSGKNMYQVYDKDSLDHTFKLSTKNTCGGLTEFSIVQAPKLSPRGVIKTNFGLNGVLVDATLHTDAAKASSFEVKRKNILPKQLPGLNVAAVATSSDKDFSAKPKYGVFETLKLDYSRANFSATAGVTTDYDSNHSATASAAVGFEGFSVGGDVKVLKTGDAPAQAKSYNAGVSYQFQKYYNASLVSDAKFEKLKATFSATRVNGSAYTFGAQAKVDLQAPKVGAPQREVILSVEQQATPNTTYKLAVVATNGVIVGGIVHRLTNPSLLVSATAATALPNSLTAPFAITKFGVDVTVGDF